MNKTQLRHILKSNDHHVLEDCAQHSKKLTQQYFGRTISLYAPLYLSNYCSSHCTYCGFNSQNRIRRLRLSAKEMHQEMKKVADTGIENILLLTGESYKATPNSYLKEAVGIAKEYFTSISLEVHPMEVNEYKELYTCGVDGITVYQETYDQKRYREVHLSGKKSDFTYRYKTAERIAQSGIRQISLGILLGLSDPVEDVLALFDHLHFMEKNYPGVEYSVSYPRLRTIKGREFAICSVDDIMLTKIICLTRIQFPRIGINLSTRESESFRNNLLELGITKISAGSNTAVGGYSLENTEDQEPQFDINDKRGLDEIITLLKKRNFDPVLTDWRPIENEPLAR